MEKNEVITLSSDDESEFTHRLEYNLNSSTTITRCSKNSSDTLKSYLQKFDQTSVSRNVDVNVKCNENEVKNRLGASEKKYKEDAKKKDPEFVDLVECVEKPNDSSSQSQCRGQKSNKTMQNHSKVDIICIDETPVQNAFPVEKKSDENANLEQGTKKMLCVLPLEDINKNEEKIINNIISNTSKPVRNNEIEKLHSKTDEEIKADDNSNQNLKLFTEFVELCGSLEEIPNDRARLTKKLMKRYGEADCSYIKSQEFRDLIQKCKDKVNTYNLYLIAKEITDELSYQKKLEINIKKPNQVKVAKGKSQSVVECNEKIQKINGERTKNLTKFINRIVKKLDKLGSKIRELETQEVDLSDEEESSYVQLQRYRERFCQIYTKLCKYTNEIADADRFYSRKICFTESKYPAINKCIENWLNKTRTFPDFSDIMKLLESQSSSLDLPSNRESIRMIAIEIFQKVGAMLQRRRVYDLWDSFCGFLDEGEDPANADPSLDKVLKSNFETRIKKEQEIFQYFVELQEKERLEPKEVLDEEANHSPVESGNEDHEEIEDIENFLNKKLDVAIKKETEEKGNNAWSDGENDSEKKTQPRHSLKSGNTVKESKNNFKNCKSLKWRVESGGKMGSVNSEEGNAATEIEKEKEMENFEGDISDPTQPDSKEENKKPEESVKNSSNPDFVALNNIKSNPKEVYKKIISATVSRCLPPSKRAFIVKDKDKNQIPKKKKCTVRTENKLDFEISNLNGDNDISMEKTKVFNVQCCQILTDGIFENISEKKRDWGKKRVFRDLTNVNRLMELYGKSNKVSGLYSSSFFHRTFSEFEKYSWKKRYKMSFKFVGSKHQKCALNQEEKSKKTINSSKGPGKKGIKNNPESGRNDQGDGFFSGHGNGREEDNNEDKNQRNGKSTEDVNENQFEEDDDEEENDAEKDDNKIDTETTVCDLNKKELSFANKKTEEPLEINQNNILTSNIQTNTSENEGTTQLSNAQSKTPASDSKSVNESKEQSCDQKIISTRKKSKTQKNDRQFNKEKKSRVKISKSENKVDVGNTEKELSNMKCSQSASKIVTRNSKTDANDFTPEITKRSLRNQKTEKESTEGAPKIKQNENGNKKIQSNTRTRLSTDQTVTEVKDESKSTARNKRKKNSCSGGAKADVRRKISDILKKNHNARAQTITQNTDNKWADTWKSPGTDTSSQIFQRKNTPSTSDDEIVKRFLMSSPASISITPPRRLSLSKPPSQAALQALATLRNLKGISTTIVKSKPKNEDDVIVIDSSYESNQSTGPGKRRRSDLPVISSVRSIDSTTPKIVTVQGNVSGFENSWPGTTNNSNSKSNSSLSSNAIRISNVWGNLPGNFMQSEQNNRSSARRRSSRQSDPGSSSNSVKKKNTEKKVEYVVLE